MLENVILGFILLPLFGFAYCCKWIVSYIAVLIYRKRNRRRFDKYNCNLKNDTEKIDMLFQQQERDLESPFPESHLTNGVDEVFCYGVNSKYECLVVRVSRETNGSSEAWIYAKLANGITYDSFISSPPVETFQKKNVHFTCGGLDMCYLAPMRRWRIFYSGLLRETTKDGERRMVFVNFTFLWKASSDVFDSTADFSTESLAASLADAKWTAFASPLKNLFESFDIYAQSGAVHGIMSIGENPDYEMYLFGERIRNLSKTMHLKGCQFTHLLGSIPETGLVVHLGKLSIPKVAENLYFGFVVQPDFLLKVIKSAKITLRDLSNERLSCVEASFTTAANTYEVKGDVIDHLSTVEWGQVLNRECDVYHVNMSINGFSGSGLCLLGKIIDVPERAVKEPLFFAPKVVPLVVNIGEKASCFLDISGGKGASLGRLTMLSGKNETFLVPKGIILTTAAYKEFLTPAILQAVKLLEDVLYGNVDGNVKTQCENILKIVSDTELPHKICRDIEMQLGNIFGDNFKRNELKFAVRSSSTVEDTDQLFAAGQMDTFLGIQSLSEIFVAVKKCWASQFGFTAVEYKRSNGQILNSPMAVVIQEMVASETAGVLFTCHPVTGNPLYISITANYGLGESVVSGSEEPDTITLQRHDDDHLEVESIEIGTKQHRIIMKEGGGTFTEDISEEKRSECCLDNETAKRLGKVAQNIEHYFKYHQDIEWSIFENKIYILQSRPVTTIKRETEFELKHEFDAPLRCENEYISLFNVGEVVPGAMSPLGLDLLENYMLLTIWGLSVAQGKAVLNYKYFSVMLAPFYNHIMMPVLGFMAQFGGKEDSIETHGVQISIFGKIIDDPEIKKATYLRFPCPKGKSRIAKLVEFKDLFFAGSNIPGFGKKLERYHIPYEKYTSAEDMFHHIATFYSYHIQVFIKHMLISEVSSKWNMFLFLLLGKAKNAYDTDVYSDFAHLLSTCKNVESADIPSAIQELAFCIAEDFGGKEFKALDVQEAQKLLETTSRTSGVKFRAFLKRHGHRCLGEFDVHSLTWDMDIKSLVKILQGLAGSCERSAVKSELDFKKMVADLKVPLDFKSRCLLKFLLPWCRKGVADREAIKSILIKTMDTWRKDFYRLSKLMVSEGRIPDSDLMFFFTVNEISELLKTRSAALIAKANRRRRLLPEMNSYMFPTLFKGIPRPINADELSEETEAEFSMQGIPVSKGTAKGYARVTVSLEEAAALKPGEILITYGTDVGWTPYFPFLAGVVTELGGLISHGAVVSREYGLPCVVGLHGATKRFCTGDYVLLDGNNGILKRLPKRDDNGVDPAK